MFVLLQGSFNWRMLFDITLPMKPMECVLSYKIWDKDLLSPNDYVSECQISFAEEAKIAFENDRSVQVIIFYVMNIIHVYLN